MQTSLEFTFCCVFTIRYAEYNGSICALINYTYAYGFAVLVSLFPVFCFIFYKRKYETFKPIESINGEDDDLNFERFKLVRSKGVKEEDIGKHLKCWRFNLKQLC